MAEYTLQFTVMKRIRVSDDKQAFVQAQHDAQHQLEMCSSIGPNHEIKKGNATLTRIIRHRKPTTKTRPHNRHRGVRTTENYREGRSRMNIDDLQMQLSLQADGIADLQQRSKELLTALRRITSNKHVNLADLIYKVRESEGLGWGGPEVAHWNDAVVAVEEILIKYRDQT